MRLKGTAFRADLQSLPSLLATAHVRYPGRTLRIGPSSLGACSSPLGRQPASSGTRRVALARRDPRTRGLFGAAWLVGHVALAALAGAEAVSVMSLRGDASVLDEAVDGRMLRRPSFFALVQLARLKPLKPVTVSNTTQIAALTSVCDGRADWLIANLTDQVIDLTLGGAPSARVMDVVAWQAYASGQAASPWRELHVGDAGRAGHTGVLQLDAFAIATE